MFDGGRHSWDGLQTFGVYEQMIAFPVLEHVTSQHEMMLDKLRRTDAHLLSETVEHRPVRDCEAQRALWTGCILDICTTFYQGIVHNADDDHFAEDSVTRPQIPATIIRNLN